MYLGLGRQDGFKEYLFENAQIFEGLDFECSKTQRKTRWWRLKWSNLTWNSKNFGASRLCPLEAPSRIISIRNSVPFPLLRLYHLRVSNHANLSLTESSQSQTYQEIYYDLLLVGNFPVKKSINSCMPPIGYLPRVNSADSHNPVPSLEVWEMYRNVLILVNCCLYSALSD